MSNKQKNTGNVCLPALQSIEPTLTDAYMIVARDLMQGVEALSVEKHISSRSCSLIAAHALECILKAYLVHNGKEEEVRKRDIQHNLLALWDMAFNEESLFLPETPPNWVTTLSNGHGPNFYFRYQEGVQKPGAKKGKKQIVHGGQTPALAPMAIELKELLKNVSKILLGEPGNQINFA